MLKSEGKNFLQSQEETYYCFVYSLQVALKYIFI